MVPFIAESFTTCSAWKRIYFGLLTLCNLLYPFCTPSIFTFGRHSTAQRTTGSPQGHHRVTTGSPQGHHRVTTGSPQGHHRVTTGSPQGANLLLLNCLPLIYLYIRTPLLCTSIEVCTNFKSPTNRFTWVGLRKSQTLQWRKDRSV